jgi:hypothetical protein
MNERIKLLAEQAEKYADYNFKGENFWSEAYESKFAELIVRECVQVARAGIEFGPSMEEAVYTYFGVEE